MTIEYLRSKDQNIPSPDGQTPLKCMGDEGSISMIEKIKNQVKTGDYRFTIHGFERCVERHISPKEVKYAILSGEVIEEYSQDKYGPSCLIYGTSEERKIEDGDQRSEVGERKDRGQKSEVGYGNKAD